MNENYIPKKNFKSYKKKIIHCIQLVNIHIAYLNRSKLNKVKEAFARKKFQIPEMYKLPTKNLDNCTKYTSNDRCISGLHFTTSGNFHYLNHYGKD